MATFFTSSRNTRSFCGNFIFCLAARKQTPLSLGYSPKPRKALTPDTRIERRGNQHNATAATENRTKTKRTRQRRAHTKHRRAKATMACSHIKFASCAAVFVLLVY